MGVSEIPPEKIEEPPVATARGSRFVFSCEAVQNSVGAAFHRRPQPRTALERRPYQHVAPLLFNYAVERKLHLLRCITISGKPPERFPPQNGSKQALERSLSFALSEVQLSIEVKFEFDLK